MLKLVTTQIVLVVLLTNISYSQAQAKLMERTDSLLAEAKMFADESDILNYEATFLELELLYNEQPDSLTKFNTQILLIKADVALKKHDFIAAIVAIDKCLELFVDSSQKQSKHRVLALNMKGIILESLGRFQEATGFRRKAYLITKSNKRAPNEDVARYANGMGTSMLTLGKVDSALIYIKEAVQLLEKDSIQNQQLLIAPYTNLGKVYEWKNRLNEALIFYNKALKLSVKLNGRYSLSAGDSYTGIGIVQELSGNFDQAIRYKELALISYKKSLGETHIYTGYAYLNLGVAYSYLNNFSTALENYLSAKKNTS